MFIRVDRNRDGGLIKTSALRQSFQLVCQYTCRMSERELKSELDFPGTRVKVKPTKPRSGALSEVRGVSGIVVKGQVSGLQPGVVHAVEEIEDLSPELNAITFTNSPILIYREIDVFAGWHSYNSAAQIAKATCGG